MSEGKCRILIVDDDRDILELLKASLDACYEILTVSDPTNAMEAADLFEPDIVLLDIMMPKVTGYKILEQMRAHEKLQNLYVVLLSAKDSHHDIKYGYKLGANLYVTKPFNPQRLLLNINMACEQNHIKPRQKSLSMRDVTLRLQMKATAHLNQQQQQQQPIDPTDLTPSSGVRRLRRPLGQELDEQKEKKWVG